MAIKIDARKLWDEGGYSKDHDFDISMRWLKKQADERGMPQTELDLILTEFFIELSKDPKKYFNEEGDITFINKNTGEKSIVRGHRCDCKNEGCLNTNSGTYAVHHIRDKMDEWLMKKQKEDNDIFTERLNKMIIAHIEDDNKAYLEEHGPKKYKWHDMPTFKKMFRIK